MEKRRAGKGHYLSIWSRVDKKTFRFHNRLGLLVMQANGRASEILKIFNCNGDIERTDLKY